MKWKKKTKAEKLGLPANAAHGTLETVTRFLWRQLTINGETRWLERTSYLVRFENYYGNTGKWQLYRWVNP